MRRDGERDSSRAPAPEHAEVYGLGNVDQQVAARRPGLGLQRHFPPGTSKWNKIEHRMFCHITENWRGRPLVSREVVVNLMSPQPRES